MTIRLAKALRRREDREVCHPLQHEPGAPWLRCPRSGEVLRVKNLVLPAPQKFKLFKPFKLFKFF
jgi:hypothetical protein